ncbi:MAG: UbiA family prenyltransferase [Haloferacaceae archaeon]
MAQKPPFLEEADARDRFQSVEAVVSEDQQRDEAADSRAVRYSQRLYAVLTYSSTHLALIATTQALLAIVLLSLPLTLAPLIVGLTTFAVYANDRLADVETDVIGKPNQSTFVQRHQNGLYFLASLAYGLAVALSTLGGPIALGITLLPGVFWILYASDWLPRINSQLQRLKNVLFVNTGLVATAWAVTLTFLPLQFADVPATPLAGFVFAYFFIEVTICTEIPNVRDVDEDRAIGARTMPVVFGIDRTRQLLYVLDLLVAAVVIYLLVEGYLSLVPAGALLTGVAYSLGVTSLVGRAGRERLLPVVADARDVVVFLVLVAGSVV